VAFYSLQQKPHSTEAGQLKSLPFRAAFDDLTFAETAAIVSNLDLVISVDTAVAHVAGALGRPVWTLLPFAPDWRWMLHRGDTPWYPTMRLFRQPRLNDWPSVLKQVKAEIAALSAAHQMV
jgi:ADP-heptose:LPS heptosyltransferase